MSNALESVVSISDSNLENLSRLLANDESDPPVTAHTAPFGQVMQTLLDADNECWRRGATAAVIWTKPEGVIDSFKAALDFESVSTQSLLDEVDRFCVAVSAIASRVRTVLVPTWTIPAYLAGYGLLEMRPGLGLRAQLQNMNLRLAENLGKTPGVYVLDSTSWFNGPDDAFNPKLWYLTKVAYGNSVFKSAVRDIKATLSALRGNSRKIVIVDLDDTIWGGVVGDVGWEKLRLGGHDAVGEAFVDFQRALKSLANRGILLGIVSKNEESIALKAIDSNSEMVLRTRDFAGWRINWDDKAKNIVELMNELNLGIDSAVFLDDNPVERARVRDALPGVLVPDFPSDPLLARKGLLSLACFASPVLSREDLERNRMYQAQQARENFKGQFGSVDEWLNTLGTRVVVEELSDTNRERTCQLLNKTNQMNLATRRLTENELEEWALHPTQRVWTFKVADKFGDSGLVGIGSLQIEQGTARVVDFVLSCRVMGRRVEDAMLHVLTNCARSLGASALSVRYVPSDKNKPCLSFLQRSGLECSEIDSLFTGSMERDFPCPPCINLVMECEQWA